MIHYFLFLLLMHLVILKMEGGGKSLAIFLSDIVMEMGEDYPIGRRLTLGTACCLILIVIFIIELCLNK
jgi:hypothetical protein